MSTEIGALFLQVKAEFFFVCDHCGEKKLGSEISQIVGRHFKSAVVANPESAAALIRSAARNAPKSRLMPIGWSYNGKHSCENCLNKRS